MTAPIFDLATQLKSKAQLSTEDTLSMRRMVWPDGKIDPAEAEAIFDLNNTVRDTSPEWVDFFVEALTDYVVHQQVPSGYVDEAKANWLMTKIDSDGRVESLGELELLVKLLEAATSVPDSLKAYALQQIEAAVASGTGPTRDGAALDPGSINTTEVKLLRRILFAQGSDGPATISRAEAAMLFRLKDATLSASNAPEWKTFFVQAVGNHLMVATNYQPLDRARAAELETFMNDTDAGVGRFLRRMLKARVKDGVAAVRKPDELADMGVFAEDAVDADELAWAKATIDHDRILDPLEEALVAFVAQERGTKLI